MEQIEVGEYIRTHSKIRKVTNPNFYMPQYVECGEDIVWRNDIVKHSPNIIDLIEVGDIVKTYDVLNNDIIYIWSEDMLKALKEDVENGIGIESIVTHEQFASMEYKIQN